MSEWFLVVRTDRLGHRTFFQKGGSFGPRATAERFASTTAAWRTADSLKVGSDALLVVPTKEA